MLANHEIRRASSFAQHPSKIILPLFMDKIQTIDTSTLSQYLVSNIIFQAKEEGQMEGMENVSSESSEEEAEPLIKVVKNKELETSLQQAQQLMRNLENRKSIQASSPELKGSNKSRNRLSMLNYHRTCQSVNNFSTPNESAKKRNKSILFNSAKQIRNIDEPKFSLQDFVKEVKSNRLQSSSYSCSNLIQQAELEPQKTVTIVTSRLQNSSKKPPRTKSKSHQQNQNFMKHQRAESVQTINNEMMSQISTHYKTATIAKNTPDKNQRRQIYSQRAALQSQQTLVADNKFAKYLNPPQNQKLQTSVTVIKCFAHI